MNFATRYTAFIGQNAIIRYMTDQANSTDRMRAFLVLVATAATIAFNALAATGRINGVMTDEVSNRFPTVLTPAGFTFSIWALIYLGLVGFSIYQTLPSKIVAFRPIRTMYLLTCVLNCAWLWFWHQYQIGVCLVLIIALLGVLFVMNLRFTRADTFADALFGKGVFGLYFGWVTTATLVNFVIFLVYAGVQMSPTAWNIIGALLLIFAAGLGVLVRFRLKNYLFPLAIAWASTGIAVKQTGNTMVIAVAAFCVMLGLVMAISFVMDQKSTTS